MRSDFDITNMAKGDTLFEAWTSKRRGMPTKKTPTTASAKSTAKHATTAASVVVESSSAPPVVDIEAAAAHASGVTTPSVAPRRAIKPVGFPQAKQAMALFVGSFQMKRSTALCLLVFYTAIVFLAFQAGQRATTSAGPIVPPKAMVRPHATAVPQPVSAAPPTAPAASSTLKALSSTSVPKAAAASGGDSWDTLLREGKAPARAAHSPKPEGR